MSGIYVASKAWRGPMWRMLRDQGGFPICSSWIDESEPGATSDWADLWVRCAKEAKAADAGVLWWSEGEALKGALVEIGIELASNVPVFWCGPRLSVCAHPLVTIVNDLIDALTRAAALVAAHVALKRKETNA